LHVRNVKKKNGECKGEHMNPKNVAGFIVLAIAAALIYVVYTSKECKLDRKIATEGLVR
jgi:hypothetical protein